MLSRASTIRFEQPGENMELTVDQNACVAAYNALDGHNGAVIVYNYKTGDILAR